VARALIPLTVPEVRRLLLALDDPPERFSLRLAWSRWRRHHQAVAKRAHAARRAGRLAAAPAVPRSAVQPLGVRDDAPSALPAELTERQWRHLAPLLPAQRQRRGRPLRDLRPMIEAMLWVERTGGSWRALPSRFGPWQDVYARYHRWRQSGLWLRIRQALDHDQATAEAACA
jgi:hypothetical protein